MRHFANVEGYLWRGPHSDKFAVDNSQKKPRKPEKGKPESKANKTREKHRLKLREKSHSLETRHFDKSPDSKSHSTSSHTASRFQGEQSGSLNWSPKTKRHSS